jgi:hypothetical protein
VSRGWLLGLAYAAIAIALFAARPASTPGPIARDFEAYWSAGSTWNGHGDPYARTIWQAERRVPGVDARRDELLPFINPPSTLPAWSAFARLPYDVAAAIWLGVLVLTLLAFVVTVLIGSTSPLGAFKLFAAIALTIAFGPMTSDLALGQPALPALFGAALLVVIADRSIPAAAAAAALAFALPNVAFGLVSQLNRTRAVLAIALGALASYALGVWAAGWGWPVRYLRAAAAHGAAERFVMIQLTPGAIAYGFGATPRAAITLAAAAALLAAGAIILFIVCLREPFARFAACSALVPFVATFAHEHDLVVAFPAALWCALRTRGTTRALAFAGTLLVAIDWLGLAQRPTGIAQSGLLALGGASAFVALGERVEKRSLLRPVVLVAGLFAAAASLAAHHPAPVWPDALGAFHAPASASAAAVWQAEQRASGLLAVAPAWATLRALSLLGCALLAYAIYRHSSRCRTA